jgi:hypothetical protein
MNLNLSNLEVDLEQVADSALTVIPGNPAFAVPLEKGAVHWLFTYLASYLQAKANATTAASSVQSAVAAGAAAGAASVAPKAAS